ncbi:MAG: hypothetical protein AAF447_01470 [Myxococcota bacterium]
MRWRVLGADRDFGAAALAFVLRGGGVPLGWRLAHPPLGAARELPTPVGAATLDDGGPEAAEAIWGCGPLEAAERGELAGASARGVPVLGPPALALPGLVSVGTFDEGALWAAAAAPNGTLEVYGAGTFLGRIGAPLPGSRFAVALLGAVVFAAELAAVPVRDALELASRFPGAQGVLEPVARVGARTFRRDAGHAELRAARQQLLEEATSLDEVYGAEDDARLDARIAAAALAAAARDASAPEGAHE